MSIEILNEEGAVVDGVACRLHLSDNCDGIIIGSLIPKCKNCLKEYRRAYYEKNKERLSTKSRQRYVPNGNKRGRPSLKTQFIRAYIETLESNGERSLTINDLSKRLPSEYIPADLMRIYPSQ